MGFLITDILIGFIGFILSLFEIRKALPIYSETRVTE
jgi:hypothetical protein